MTVNTKVKKTFPYSIHKGDYMMKFKNLMRIALFLVLVFNVFGVGAQAQAQIVIRSTTIWDATFFGNVDSTRYERWSLQLEDANAFVITVTTVSGNLVPEIFLLDSSETELAHSAGSGSSSVLSTSQPAGNYFIQVQPQSGSGDYSLTIRQADAPNGCDPSGAVTVDPASIIQGGTATATVMLNNVPAEGYTSAEFTCSYNPALIEVGGFTDAGLFGVDAVMVVNGPEGGSFIVGIAGSNGRKATTSGAVFTFAVTGLGVGEAVIECQTRVSTGGALTSIPSTSATVTILEPMGTLTGTVIASKPVTISLYDDVGVTEAIADQNGYFSITAPPGSYIVVASAPGFLKAQGTPTLTAGATTTMQTISLLAGDIDGNDVIDQFDAMTIGINYGASAPAEADLNNDGVIDVLDLELLAANYRQSGALAWQ
jgi:hypothetical protein